MIVAPNISSPAQLRHAISSGVEVHIKPSKLEQNPTTSGIHWLTGPNHLQSFGWCCQVLVDQDRVVKVLP